MKVFYGSSTEFSEALRILIKRINFGSPIHWEASFPNGRSFLTSLLETASQVDSAVFLMTPEDGLTERGANYLTPRDNLIFEAGIMVHALGPENVFLVYPDIGEPEPFSSARTTSPRPKHLSDLAGINYLSCGKMSPTDNAAQFDAAFADVPLKIREGLGKFQPKTQISYIDGIFPIYNNLNTADWHEAFRSALGSKAIDPKLMYYGPGLAKYWLKMADSERYRRKDELFEREIGEFIEYLELKKLQVEGISIIDLGVGNGRSGRCTIDTIERYIDNNSGINYVALDISQDMLIAAIRDDRMQNCLRSIKNRGSTLGICGDFYHLDRISSLIPRNTLRVFLLLGNTLGNERSEIDLLRAIRRSMTNQDILLLEICLNSDDITPEVRLIDSTESTFDTGSFRCFGLLPEELEVREVTELRDFGSESSYQVRCIKPRNLHHPAIAPLHVQDTWFDMMHIRRYNSDAFDKILSIAGMQAIKSKDVTLKIGDESKIFRYIAARRGG